MRSLTHASRCARAAALLLAAPTIASAQTPRFTVGDTSVRQGRFEAIAIGRDTIISSYPRARDAARIRWRSDEVNPSAR